MKDLEQLAEVVSQETAEHVDQNNPNIMDKVGKYFSDNKFVCPKSKKWQNHI